jgi:hypothetical protein
MKCGSKGSSCGLFCGIIVVFPVGTKGAKPTPRLDSNRFLLNAWESCFILRLFDNSVPNTVFGNDESQMIVPA